jgi:peptidoglycan/LPS O-acetylase OafA/YrhL
MQKSSNRLIPLEAYRGIAAFVVLVHHYFLGFSPYTTGLLEERRNSESLVGQPFFALLSGTSAVAFFFTLSGFVLCWSYFNNENPQKLLLSFLKRFPRLVAIVTITTLSSYALFRFGLYYFREAAEVSSSPWLATFAYADWTPAFEPSFFKALAQGLTTFFTGQANYNTNLWTMRPEFFGSMVVYMLACFVSMVLGYRYLLYAFAVLSVSAIGYNQHIFPFVVGTFLSAHLAKRKAVISFPIALMLTAVGLYFLGYIIPEKSYAWVSFMPGALRGYIQTFFHTLGSACIIFATMANQRLFHNLSGSFFRLLGQLSFPLYLVHTLVICSISSYAYLYLTHAGVDSGLILITVFLITVGACIGLALPLSRFDDWWVGRVNASAKHVMEKTLHTH